MDFRIPNVYTLGQIQLNTQPLVQLQGQLLAKRKAQEDALDKYFSDFAGKLTTTGMRQQDIPGFLKRKDELMKEGIARKDEIAKGGLAKQEFSSKFDNLFGDIERSKQAAKLQYDLAQAKQKGDLNEDDFPTLDAISRSIYEDAHYKDPVTKETYSFADFSPAVNLPDTSKQASYWSAVSQGYTPKLKEYEKDERGNIVYKPTMPGSFTRVAKFNEKFSDDQIVGMANRAANFTSADKSFRKLYTGFLNEAAKATEANAPLNPRFVELKKVYDQYFPGDIMDRPEEVAKADAILRFKTFTNTGEEKFTDVRAQKAYESALISSRQKGGAGEEVDLSLYDVLGPYTETKGVQSKGLFGGFFGGRGKTLVYRKDIDPKDYELIADKDVLPFVDANGEEFFEVDPNTGDWKAENATISAASVARRNLDRTTLAEEKRGVTQFKPGLPIPAKKPAGVKTYNVGGKTFTLEQMKKGAQKSKMSLDDYLKSIGAK